MSDDHAAHAMSCYGSRINETPNIDRIAHNGARLDNCFCTNSICAPSRAVILTGKHTHLNGVRTLADRFDGRQETVPKILQRNGYQTAIFGKWHLGEGGNSSPTGFDHWVVLPGQGDYHDPLMLSSDGEKVYEGYVTDIVTDLSLQWLDQRDQERPFMLMCHHKAPHRWWEPDDKHMHLYEGEDIPLPDTLHDDYSHRSEAAKRAKMRVSSDFFYRDLKLKTPEGHEPTDFIHVPEDLTDFSLCPIDGEPVTFTDHKAVVEWLYQRYIKDYLRCVAAIDDNVGRVLDYLDENNLTEDTIVIYTSDQGFFLGDHGWYDKRFMYEESLRMPLVVQYPKEIPAGSFSDTMVLNLDFGKTFLDYAGIAAPQDMQGHSLRPILCGETPAGWRTSMYYRYWMHLSHHNVAAHYGVRTHEHKLIYYYGEAMGTSGSVDVSTPKEWELFDLENDPQELRNVYDDPDYAAVRESLTKELERLKKEALDFQ